MQKKQNARRRGLSRKTTILLIAAGVVVIAAAIILLLTLGGGQSPYENRGLTIGDSVIPNADGLRAMRYDLATADDASDYFLRLLDSVYLGLSGNIACSVEPTDGKWHLYGEAADGTEAAAVFDLEGVITEITVGAYPDSTMKNSPAPYTLENGGENVFAYLRAFVYAYLPDINIVSGRIVSDQYNENGRFLTCETANRFADPAHEFIVQVEPEERIIGFRLLADENLAVVRSSPKEGAEPVQDDTEDGDTGDTPIWRAEAVQTARDALCLAYDIPASEAAAYILVDATRYDVGQNWYGYSPDTPYWLVSFRFPNSDDRVYSDYDVIIDAATGEVLIIFDPSNNSNG
jgi:hypothetical protein